MKPWLRLAEDGATLVIHAQPGAKRSELAGRHGDALKIRLAAPAIEGRANACLIDFLARRLGVPKSSVELLAGALAREKRVRVRGATREALEGLDQP
ncbi:MAG TPA: hypothetical protein DHV08_10205 [Rhodocyclaceae bacterium]|nr:MAG: hypothetical protein AUK49_10265 [Betaproteobacteria bacterium CG2_30_68_42]PIV72097.1 MAG: hypothetical protein COW56_11095 [Rhodocyclales bacterium CG17_big_fil_post_rev_8_21_14_2_50_68_7]PIX75823.1 MAG: hypothetical protein COZ38_03560 [Rhodocyclales bacterium CG_4_10_14_3_um_filter_68_10]PJA56325.1 MAG: hypothetical protein CO164_13510 [Rhodocyclales bacterium CG_4_9_14_3_um_filter_68_10]HCX33885.1 hypothetical protein [Rhodocyclaceae bacterium]